MNNLTNWAYGFTLNHETANVGTIYYAQKYFDKEGIVNPASAELYTTDEINKIKNSAIEGATNYTTNVPENALLGMNPLNTNKIYWYDELNSNKILKSTNPLILNDENGDMKDTEGNIIAKSM